MIEDWPQEGPGIPERTWTSGWDGIRWEGVIKNKTKEDDQHGLGLRGKILGWGWILGFIDSFVNSGVLLLDGIGDKISKIWVFFLV